MIQPNDLKLELPIIVANCDISSTTKVWEILKSSYDDNLQKVRELADECPALVYAQYNYAPPIYFAVREVHTEIANFLLDKGAFDPDYRSIRFKKVCKLLQMIEVYLKLRTCF